MRLLIDNADIQKIKEAYSIFPLQGVTTNPSILAAGGRPPFEVLREIREFIGKQGIDVIVVINQTMTYFFTQGRGGFNVRVLPRCFLEPHSMKIQVRH